MNERLASYDKYSLYKVVNKKVGTYYLCVPGDEINNYQMFLGFVNKDLDKLSNEDIILEIKTVNDLIQNTNPNAIYVVPVIPVTELEQAALENDNRKYNDILINRIQPITTDVFRMLIKTSHGVKKMDQSINVVKKYDFDKKFSGWLATNPSVCSFITEVDFDKLEKPNASYNSDVQSNMLEHDVDDNNQNIEQNKTRTLKPNNNTTSPGFGNIKFIIITLLGSLVFGVLFSYLLIK